MLRKSKSIKVICEFCKNNDYISMTVFKRSKYEMISWYWQS
ncbi:MAG: hypothetical protein ACTSRP_21640 [Candidatus Helarchaeota archaeon]